MNPSPNWRDRFIDLAAELCRARGEAPPHAHSDEDHALRLALHVDGVEFEALHPPAQAFGADRFLLRCPFGPVPDDAERTLRQALEMNFELCRLQVGGFGFDADTQELVFCTPQSLHDADGGTLLVGLQNIAALALVWRQTIQPPLG